MCIQAVLCGVKREEGQVMSEGEGEDESGRGRKIGREKVMVNRGEGEGRERGRVNQGDGGREGRRG